MKALVRLYPRAWRDRYEDEFEAVLEARPIGPFDAVDVVLGALDAHRRAVGRPRPITPRKEIRMSARLGGLAAVATGLLWFGVLVALAIPENELLGAASLGLSMAALIVAVVGLGAAQGRAHPVAMWIAVAIPVIGAVVTSVGFLVLLPIYGDTRVVADLEPWLIGSLGAIAVMVGSVLFGLVTLVSRVLSRPGAALISVGGIALLGFGFGGAITTEPSTQLLFVAFGVLFGVGWLWLGRNAIQAGPRPA